MLRVGMLAAQERMLLALRDTAPGLPKQGPPWDIEGEPEGRQIFTLKRPFEANEGNDVGHTGHHKNEASHIKAPSVSSAPQIPNHSPQACIHHYNTALKPPDIVVLRPIKRACGWRRRRWQYGHLNQHIMPLSHARLYTSHTSHILSCAPQIKQKLPPLHQTCILPQCPNCV